MSEGRGPVPMHTSFDNHGHPALTPGARIAVGLSGGIDSSMTAWLLKRQGFDVVGLTMQIWDGSIPLPDEGRSGCFGPGEGRDIEAAAAFAARLGIPHHVVPLAAEYRATVLDYFRAEYLAGRTPNPCVRCNRTMKFGFLLERARRLGTSFEFFATGHYARCAWSPERGRFVLLRSADASKDQTYFLSQLNQQQLGTLILPLGGLTKDAVRALAREAGFPELAEKPESQDFIEADDYGVLFGGDESKPGPMVDTAGRVVGQHRGIVHYTVGQRKGLGIGGAGEPYYVAALDAGANTVVVARRDALQGARLRAEGINWIAFDAPPAEPFRADCRIRQRHAGAPATVAAVAAGTADVTFDEPQFAVTPGQTAVFYEGDLVLGGGTIAPPKQDGPRPGRP